jgi:MoaA/NifB/PqqE/SkfB family radical SAM enzyme
MSISPYLYVGYHCNNNCIFCSEADEYLEHLKEKSIKDIKKEILNVRTKYDFITFMGREPTLRKDILDILCFANNLNFNRVGLTSNGRMFSYPRFTKKILNTGVGQIGISLSGATAKVHDKQTQVLGSFKQTIQGIRNIIRFKEPDMSFLVNLPLNRLNYLELKEMIDLLVGLGIKEINILFVAPLSRRSRTKKIVMEMSKLGKYVFNIVKPYLKNPHLKFLLVEFLPCSLPKENRKYFFPCLEKNSCKIRIPLCKNCSYRDKCDGVLQSYIDLYGIKEFKL